MAKKKLYKTVIQIEVLSEEPIDQNTSLEEITSECNSGSYSGITDWKITNKVIKGIKAAQATMKQGSSCDFFGMDEEGNEIEF